MHDDTQRLPPWESGTASRTELGLWIAVAAWACGAVVASMAGSAAAIRAVAIGGALWTTLLTGAALCKYWRRMRVTSPHWRLASSEFHVLMDRHSLQWSSTLVLIGAGALLLPFSGMGVALLWAVRVLAALFVWECAKVIYASLSGLLGGRHATAVLTARLNEYGTTVNIELRLPETEAAGVREALLELVEVPPHQDPEEGLSGRVVHAVQAHPEPGGDSQARFIFMPFNERVFEMVAQRPGPWVFSAGIAVTYLYVRLRVTGAGRSYSFAWS